VSRELVRVAIKRLGLSKKKARFFSKPKDLEKKTNLFINQREKYRKQGSFIISIDETSFGRNGRDVKGYSPVGQQLRLQRTIPRRTTTSYLVAASNEMIIEKAAYVGSFNSLSFSLFLESLPVPEGTVILLDNVSFHHSRIVKEVADRKGFVLLFVPPYSPWFNPIEGIFSIVKREFYKHGDINKSFDAVKQYHCHSFFKKSIETI
jgi:transposase